MFPEELAYEGFIPGNPYQGSARRSSGKNEGCGQCGRFIRKGDDIWILPYFGRNGLRRGSVLFEREECLDKWLLEYVKTAEALEEKGV